LTNWLSTRVALPPRSTLILGRQNRTEISRHQIAQFSMSDCPDWEDRAGSKISPQCGNAISVWTFEA
jgi:hypothetical protein